MGTSTMSTIYDAELREIVLAAQIALDVHSVTNFPSNCTIVTNNQAAIP